MVGAFSFGLGLRKQSGKWAWASGRFGFSVLAARGASLDSGTKKDA